MSGLKRFQSDGHYLDYRPAAAVTAGDVIVEANELFVADADIAAGELGAVTDHGVYEVPKEADNAITFADNAAVYWDESESEAAMTNDGGANLLMGYAIILSGASEPDSIRRGGLVADDFVRVRLLG